MVSTIVNLQAFEYCHRSIMSIIPLISIKLTIKYHPVLISRITLPVTEKKHEVNTLIIPETRKTKQKNSLKTF